MKRTALAISGLVLAFHPAFSGTKLNTHKWATCYPWFSQPKNGCTNAEDLETDWYLPSGVTVSHDTLHLTASKETTHGQPYRSGMVTTFKSFTFTYGYVSVVAKLPGGTGTWPALWLLPKSEGWPPEIDIMENHGQPHTIQTTYHYTVLGSLQMATKFPTTRANLVTHYNTYGLSWEAHSITWYLNGKVIDRYTGPNISNQPMYLVANLAIDGPAKSGATFSIKSVRIYTNKR